MTATTADGTHGCSHHVLLERLTHPPRRINLRATDALRDGGVVVLSSEANQ
jgi:hypothetical protein